MSLPPALLARLKNRGIVRQEKKAADEEEVFAEDYDESDESGSSEDQNGSESEETETKTISQPKETNVPSETSINKNFECPNSNNPFHECTSYCRKKYATKRFEPHPVMEKRRQRMLKIYPLLPNWKEVPDINTNRYYYWNTETDKVCWLSPSHPKAKYETVSIQLKIPAELPKIVSQAYHDEPSEHITENSRTVSHKNESIKSKHVPHYKKNKKDQEADPMDPSSYSDVKKGKWSAGLDAPSSVKVGSSVEEE